MVVYCCAIEELRLVRRNYGFIARETRLNPHRVSLNFANQNHTHAGLAVVDHIDEIRIGGFVADDRDTRHEDCIFATGENYSSGCEHAGAQCIIWIWEACLQDENTRTGIHCWIYGGYFTLKLTVGISGDVRKNRHAKLRFGSALFRRLQLEL